MSPLGNGRAFAEYIIKVSHFNIKGHLSKLKNSNYITSSDGYIIKGSTFKS